MPSAPFEMRRLEMLSNTIFGVAMTLLAYDLPRGRLSTATPNWAAIWQAYGTHVIALFLSFIVAGMFWIGHQRRLAHATHANRIVLFGNLLFLLLIVLLPGSTGLYGAYGNAPDVVLLYAAHLTAIAFVNVALWWFADTPHRDWASLTGAGFVLGVNTIALGAAFVAPLAAAFLWPLGCAGLLVTALVDRRLARRAV